MCWTSCSKCMFFMIRCDAHDSDSVENSLNIYPHHCHPHTRVCVCVCGVGDDMESEASPICSTFIWKKDSSHITLTNTWTDMAHCQQESLVAHTHILTVTPSHTHTLTHIKVSSEHSVTFSRRCGSSTVHRKAVSTTHCNTVNAESGVGGGLVEEDEAAAAAVEGKLLSLWGLLDVKLWHQSLGLW